MRVLVTGASGFIGARVAAELTARGAEVRAFCRSEPRVSDWVRGDVTDAAALARAATHCGAVCVNPTTVVGPGDRLPTPSGKMIRDLVEGGTRAYLRGAGLNVVAVEDVARGHVLALDRGRAGDRYILGGDDLWLRDVFATVLAAVGRKPPRVAVPWGGVYAAALAADSVSRLLRREPKLLVLDEVRLARLPLFFSSDKARAELGYEPGPAADALAAAARWFAGRAS